MAAPKHRSNVGGAKSFAQILAPSLPKSSQQSNTNSTLLSKARVDNSRAITASYPHKNSALNNTNLASSKNLLHGQSIAAAMRLGIPPEGTVRNLASDYAALLKMKQESSQAPASISYNNNSANNRSSTISKLNARVSSPSPPPSADFTSQMEKKERIHSKDMSSMNAQDLSTSISNAALASLEMSDAIETSNHYSASTSTKARTNSILQISDAREKEASSNAKNIRASTSTSQLHAKLIAALNSKAKKNATANELITTSLPSNAAMSSASAANSTSGSSNAAGSNPSASVKSSLWLLANNSLFAGGGSTKKDEKDDGIVSEKGARQQYSDFQLRSTTANVISFKNSKQEPQKPHDISVNSSSEPTGISHVLPNLKPAPAQSEINSSLSSDSLHVPAPQPQRLLFSEQRLVSLAQPKYKPRKAKKSVKPSASPAPANTSNATSSTLFSGGKSTSNAPSLATTGSSISGSHINSAAASSIGNVATFKEKLIEDDTTDNNSTNDSSGYANVSKHIVSQGTASLNLTSESQATHQPNLAPGATNKPGKPNFSAAVRKIGLITKKLNRKVNEAAQVSEDVLVLDSIVGGDSKADPVSVTALTSDPNRAETLSQMDGKVSQSSSSSRKAKAGSAMSLDESGSSSSSSTSSSGIQFVNSSSSSSRDSQRAHTNNALVTAVANNAALAANSGTALSAKDKLHVPVFSKQLGRQGGGGGLTSESNSNSSSLLLNTNNINSNHSSVHSNIDSHINKLVQSNSSYEETDVGSNGMKPKTPYPYAARGANGGSGYRSSFDTLSVRTDTPSTESANDHAKTTSKSNAITASVNRNMRGTGEDTPPMLSNFDEKTSQQRTQDGYNTNVASSGSAVNYFSSTTSNGYKKETSQKNPSRPSTGNSASSDSRNKSASSAVSQFESVSGLRDSGTLPHDCASGSSTAGARSNSISSNSGGVVGSSSAISSQQQQQSSLSYRKQLDATSTSNFRSKGVQLRTTNNEDVSEQNQSAAIALRNAKRRFHQSVQQQAEASTTWKKRLGIVFEGVDWEPPAVPTAVTGGESSPKITVLDSANDSKVITSTASATPVVSSSTSSTTAAKRGSSIMQLASKKGSVSGDMSPLGSASGVLPVNFSSGSSVHSTSSISIPHTLRSCLRGSSSSRTKVSKQKHVTFELETAKKHESTLSATAPISSSYPASLTIEEGSTVSTSTEGTKLPGSNAKESSPTSNSLYTSDRNQPPAAASGNGSGTGVAGGGVISGSGSSGIKEYIRLVPKRVQDLGNHSPRYIPTLTPSQQQQQQKQLQIQQQQQKIAHNGISSTDPITAPTSADSASITHTSSNTTSSTKLSAALQSSQIENSTTSSRLKGSANAAEGINALSRQNRSMDVEASTKTSDDAFDSMQVPAVAAAISNPMRSLKQERFTVNDLRSLKPAKIMF